MWRNRNKNRKNDVDKRKYVNFGKSKKDEIFTWEHEVT